MSDNSNNIGTGRQGQVNDLIKIGRHGAEALLPNPKDEEKILSQFHIEEKGISLTREDKIKKIKNLYSYFLDIDPDEVRIPDKIGFEISNDSQRKILFCVLGLLTETDYQGNYQKPVPNKDKEELRLGSSTPTLGGPYKNIRQTPVLRIEKNELMQKSGFDPSKKATGGISVLPSMLSGTTDVSLSGNDLRGTRTGDDKLSDKNSTRTGTGERGPKEEKQSTNLPQRLGQFST